MVCGFLAGRLIMNGGAAFFHLMAAFAAGSFVAGATVPAASCPLACFSILSWQATASPMVKQCLGCSQLCGIRNVFNTRVQVKTPLRSPDSRDAVTSVFACQGLPGPLLPEHARIHFLRARGRFGCSCVSLSVSSSELIEL